MLLGYTRVSTAEQATDDRSSLENQEKIIRGFAMAKGFTQFEVAVYSDAGVSASVPLRKRPSGKRLFDDAKPGDTIIASKLDRMFRSAVDALNMSEIFLEKKINLVLFDLGTDPINSSGLSQFFLTVISAVAQLERTMIKERLVGGKKAKMAKGGHAGGKAPYGYRVVGTGRNAWLEEIAEEQAILAKLRAWMSERAEASIAETTRMLAAEGIVSRTGKPLYKMQVSRILDRMQRITAS